MPSLSQAHLGLGLITAALGLLALSGAMMRWTQVDVPADPGSRAVWSASGEPVDIPASQPLLLRARAHAETIPGSVDHLARVARHALPRGLSSVLSRSLATTPEQVSALVHPELGAALDARCPALPPALRTHCDPTTRARLAAALPGVLAQVLASDTDVRAEALEVSCAAPHRAAAVRTALGSERSGGWSTTARAWLTRCAGDPPESNEDSDWGAVLVDGSTAVRGAFEADTLGGALTRYGALLDAGWRSDGGGSTSKSTTAVAPAP